MDFVQELEQAVSEPVEATKELFEELAESEVRQDLIFSMLYGIWKAEKKKTNLKDVIKQYNEAKIFANVREE